ncbi:hypothetical protein OUZ56_004951 [Daphnia magna]|uniref:Uncharacterized protein n=1 Tax=Daphnia magna TaxID=35525 RepID=A0ABQ9YRC1_9CRUS|nr:hypothetical protein OUZ56_004951 [Daphnia magna]
MQNKHVPIAAQGKQELNWTECDAIQTIRMPKRFAYQKLDNQQIERWVARNLFDTQTIRIAARAAPHCFRVPSS